jgi:HNH endonuclease
MDRSSTGRVVDIENRISADLIIAAMKGLLAARREQKVSRGSFLRTWTWLRRLLNLTDEYARWRWAVRQRAGAACERCAEQGNHAHHKVPLAHDPDLALDPTNGEYLCVKCHKKHHRAESAARAARRSVPRCPPALRRPHTLTDRRVNTPARPSRPAPRAHPPSPRH